MNDQISDNQMFSFIKDGWLVHFWGFHLFVLLCLWLETDATNETHSTYYRFYYYLIREFIELPCVIIFMTLLNLMNYLWISTQAFTFFCFFFLLFFCFQDDGASVSGHQLPMVNVNVGRSNVLNRVTNQQDKWKRQVNHWKVTQKKVPWKIFGFLF